MHTKRRPLWVDFDPETDDAEALRERLVEGVARLPGAGARLLRGAPRRPTTGCSDPSPRVVLIQGVGLVAVGRTLKAARLSRDLYHRAIAVMSGADALGGFVSLTDAESFAVEYWPLELYKLSLAPPPREFEGEVALITGAAGGIGGAIARALLDLGACVVATDIDVERVQAGRRVARRQRGRAADGRDRRDARSRRPTGSPRSPSAASTSSSRTRASPSSAPIEETTLELWERNHAVLTRGYFLVAREAARLLRDAGHRRQHRLHRLEERARPGQGRVGLLVGEGRRAAPRALPRRGARARTGSASTR